MPHGIILLNTFWISDILIVLQIFIYKLNIAEICFKKDCSEKTAEGVYGINTIFIKFSELKCSYLKYTNVLGCDAVYFGRSYLHCRWKYCIHLQDGNAIHARELQTYYVETVCSFRNLGKFLPNYTASPIKQYCS